MLAMDWGIEMVPKENGRGGRYQREPTKQLPFPPGGRQGSAEVVVQAGGGQDDLMVWLGRP